MMATTPPLMVTPNRHFQVLSHKDQETYPTRIQHDRYYFKRNSRGLVFSGRVVSTLIGCRHELFAILFLR
jgi:hypothetical protein